MEEEKNRNETTFYFSGFSPEMVVMSDGLLYAEGQDGNYYAVDGLRLMANWQHYLPFQVTTRGMILCRRRKK